MEKVIRVFTSPQEADEADRAFYRSLTPQERLRILLELIESWGHGSTKGFERVYRVTELERR